MITRRKHYGATRILEADFIAQLPSGVTLSSGAAVSVISASYGSTSALTLGSASISGTKILATAAAGTAGELATEDSDGVEYVTRYVLKFSVTASNGEIYSRLGELVVYDGVQRTS